MFSFNCLKMNDSLNRLKLFRYFRKLILKLSDLFLNFHELLIAFTSLNHNLFLFLFTLNKLIIMNEFRKLPVIIVYS